MAKAVRTAEAKPGKSAQGKRGGAGRRLLFLCVAVLLSIAALAGGLTAAVGTDGVRALLGAGPAEAAEAAPDGAEAPAADAGHGGGHGAAPAGTGFEVMPFEEMIVNITSVTLNGRRTSRFLKLNLALVYDTGVEGAGRIAERRLYMRDGFQDYLRQLTESELQGSLGLATLKSELLRRARAITDSDAPQEILVADLIVQ